MSTNFDVIESRHHPETMPSPQPARLDPSEQDHQSRTATRKALLIPGMLVCLILFGLYTSLSYHFGVWGNVDSDVVNSAIFWNGLQRHGLHFVTTWAYTPDNWLFTALLPSAALYGLIGSHHISVVVGLGWLAFVADVALAAAIGTILGGRLVGLGTAACLLLRSQDALGWVGFLSHPASHGVSLAWGLASFLLMAFWVRYRSWPGLIASALCLAANCISDPWADVACALPLIAATVCVSVLQKQCRSRLLAGAALSSIALVVAMTKVFGILRFLPGSAIGLASFASIKTNASWMIRSVGWIFDPIPGIRDPSILLCGLVCLVLVILLLRTGFEFARNFRSMAPVEQTLLLCVSLSATLPIIAFLLCRLPLAISVARFAVSFSVLAPMVLLVALRRHWLRLPAWVKGTIPLLFAGIAVSAAASHPAAWATGWQGARTGNLTAFVRFLEAHKLTYGYGPYWGSSANTVTWISNGDVTIRPVTFDRVTGFIDNRSAQSSRLWYAASDLPKKQKSTFVVIKADGEFCADVTVCVSGVQRQFGPVAETLDYGTMKILVFDHPLTLQIP